MAGPYRASPNGSEPAPRHDVVARTTVAYEQGRREFLRQWGTRRYRRPPLLIACLRGALPAARVLDLGSGAGQDALFLRRAGYEVVALDVTRGLLQHARQRSAGLPLVQADMQCLPLRPGHFDGIWAAASLMHVPKSAIIPLLANLLMVVRPGGFLGATLAHGRRSGYLKDGWIPGRFIARWHKAELSRLVCRAGWHLVEVAVVTNRERKGRWVNLRARRPLSG